MSTASANASLEASREAIRAWQMEQRPLGMPPEQGLLYQPIPFPGYDDLACERGSSADRFDLLCSTLNPHAEHLLDLGCANGYFPFRFAQRNGSLASALGVDHFEGNAKTANHLAERHGLSDRVHFRQGEISEALLDEVLVEPRTLVLLLSVHHHLIREHGIEATKRIFHRLHRAVPTVVVEQGSLTQSEYEEWTQRSEPFHTRAFSRLVSMFESAGIESRHCFLVGMGRYASGRKDDRTGAGRVIVGLSKRMRAGCVLSVQRKAHKNGIYMELLTLSDAHGRPAEVWKNCVVGGSHAQREADALRALADEPGFIRFASGHSIDEADGLLRLRYEPITALDEATCAREDVSIREQCVQRLLSLAKHGLVHGELHVEHVQRREDGVVVVLDLENARHVAESFEQWYAQVAAPNPALGLGMYPRPDSRDGWDSVDLAAMDELFVRWRLPVLRPEERSHYRALLTQAQRTSR